MMTYSPMQSLGVHRPASMREWVAVLSALSLLFFIVVITAPGDEPPSALVEALQKRSFVVQKDISRTFALSKLVQGAKDGLQRAKTGPKAVASSLDSNLSPLQQLPLGSNRPKKRKKRKEHGDLGKEEQTVVMPLEREAKAAEGAISAVTGSVEGTTSKDDETDCAKEGVSCDFSLTASLTSVASVNNASAPLPKALSTDDRDMPDSEEGKFVTAMIEAHEKKSGDTGGGQKGADMNQKGDDLNREIKSCQINNGDVKAKNEASATKVSVGIYVVQVDQLHRRELKKDAAKGHSACFLVDFVLVLTEPEGSTMITDAVWDTLSFRNAEEIYSSRSLQGVPNTRRIQGAFFYTPDLRMYPADQQELKIEVLQTKFSTDQWVFVPSPDLNGIGSAVFDLDHKECSTESHVEALEGKELSAFSYSLHVRQPNKYAMITAFIPPLLIVLPAVLAQTLGPIRFHQLRFMVSICSLASISFFYTSYLRQLPILGYLTAFDKYVYCMYLWLLATIVSLGILLYIFREAKRVESPRQKTQDIDDSTLLLSVALKNELLYFSMFSFALCGAGLLILFLIWLWLPVVLMLPVLILSAVFYCWWLYASYKRIKRKHVLEQEATGGFARMLSKQETDVDMGNSFHWELLCCCCSRAFIDVFLQECCCCVSFKGGHDTEEKPEKGDDEFPSHLYASSPGEPCIICKEAGYKECIFGHGSEAEAKSAEATTSQQPPTPASTMEGEE